MNIDAVILEMNGTDPEIINISSVFCSEQYGQAIKSQTGSGLDQFYSAILIDVIHSEIESSIAATKNWILANCSALKEMECDKVLEMQILFHEDGCDFLCLDNAFLEIAAQAGLHVHVQVSGQVSR